MVVKVQEEREEKDHRKRSSSSWRGNVQALSWKTKAENPISAIISRTVQDQNLPRTVWYWTKQVRYYRRKMRARKPYKVEVKEHRLIDRSWFHSTKVPFPHWIQFCGIKKKENISLSVIFDSRRKKSTSKVEPVFSDISSSTTLLKRHFFVTMLIGSIQLRGTVQQYALPTIGQLSLGGSSPLKWNLRLDQGETTIGTKYTQLPLPRYLKRTLPLQ